MAQTQERIAETEVPQDRKEMISQILNEVDPKDSDGSLTSSSEAAIPDSKDTTNGIQMEDQNGSGEPHAHRS